jgi:hypothetical protein
MTPREAFLDYLQNHAFAYSDQSGLHPCSVHPRVITNIMIEFDKAVTEIKGES